MAEVVWCFATILALLCLLPLTVIGQEEPKITLTIYPEIKRLGMTGYLNCTVTRQSNNKVQWIRKSDDMVISSDDRVELDNTINEEVDGYEKYSVEKRVHGEQTTYMLIVRRLDNRDSGTYTCQVSFKSAGDIQPSKDGIIYVLQPPVMSRGQSKQSVSVNEGNNVTLSCSADGHPKPNITWVRVNGETLPPPYNRYAYKGNYLHLYNVRAEDHGIYRCVADNNVRPLATFDAAVSVFFRPRARAVQRSYGQAQNRLFDLTFECIIAGHPMPSMRWYHVYQGQTGMNPVIDDDKHIIHQLLSHGQVLSLDEVWYQMTIINVQANDYGVYVCEGTNKLGTDMLNITIYETSECQGANCPPEGGEMSSATKLLTSLIMLPMLYTTMILWTYV